MLEKMDTFFEARLDGYDEHMLNNIESARIFYPFTANQLPHKDDVTILDLGCGTGLELEYYLSSNPSAKITGIDLSSGMLAALKNKLGNCQLTLIHGNYFDVPFGNAVYDAAVSVESLHHFTLSEKVVLYRKLHQALKADGFFILTDYFASSDEEEKHFREELNRLKKENNVDDHFIYHYDIPLTVTNETTALQNAGFSRIDELASWGATHILKAYK